MLINFLIRVCKIPRIRGMKITQLYTTPSCPLLVEKVNPEQTAGSCIAKQLCKSFFNVVVFKFCVVFRTDYISLRQGVR